MIYKNTVNQKQVIINVFSGHESAENSCSIKL